MKAANTVLFPGYRLIEPLPPHGPGALWKIASPGGRIKSARMLPGTERDLTALQHLRSLGHTGLIPYDRIDLIDGELIFIRDLAPQTLESLLVDYLGGGRPGVPRTVALVHLREVAETLDAMAKKAGLQHLDLRPSAIALCDKRARLLDFGLAHCLAQRSGGLAEARQLGAFAPPHAAPELLNGAITLACDQYSLAATYFELVTGHAFDSGNPKLTALSAKDRSAIERGLDADPAKRYATCEELIQALLTADSREVSLATSSPEASLDLNQIATKPPASAVPANNAGASKKTPKVRSSGRHSRPSLNAKKPSQERRRLEMGPARAAASPEENGLPGYRLIECNARTSAFEVWKGETLAGNRRIIRLLLGVNALENRPDGTPLNRLLDLDHDALASTVYLPDGTNRLAVISDPGKLSLSGRFRRCQADNMPGIPRHELLDYMRLMAEAIDDLAGSSGLQHLSLTPKQLFVGQGRPRMIDFGLAQLFWLPAGEQGVSLNARYSAPELLQGRITAAADQYSLAAIYQEMLTGSHPFRQLGLHELAAGRRAKPDLTMAPATDRAALSRALNVDPTRRFPTCSDFAAALEGSARPSRLMAKAASKQIPLAPNGSRALAVASKLTPAQVVCELVQAAAGSVELREFRGIRFLMRRGECIEHRCFARLLPGTAWLKLEGFRQLWKAAGTAIDNNHFQFMVPADCSLWDRMMGRAPGLEVHVRLQRPHANVAALTEMAIDIFPVDKNAARGGRLLEDMAPYVLESIRNHLQAHKERRCQERLPFDQHVQVCSIFPNLSRGEPIAAHCRDISLHGMGLILPNEPETAQVAIRLATSEGADPVTVPGRIVRATLLPDGQYEVGINFSIRSAPAIIRPERILVK